MPYALIKEMALEARLEGMGIKEPAFISLFKDYPRLSREDKREITKTYLRLRAAKRQNHGQNH